jgi:uncharacterized protein
MTDEAKTNAEVAGPVGFSSEPGATSSENQAGFASASAPQGESQLPAAPLFRSGPEPDLWRGRDLLIFIGFAVGWAFVSGLLLLAGYAVLKPLLGWRTSPLALVDNTFFELLAQLVFYAPVVILVVLLVSAHYGLPFWAGISWRWPERSRVVKFLFGGVLLSFVVLLGSALMPDRRPFPLEKMFSSPSAAYALGAFAVLIAPFMEELIFRGVLFAFFEHLIGLRLAVVASALLFAILHYSEYAGAWTHLGMILLVGLVFSLARAFTKSVAPSFLLHTAYNGTLMLALFVGTHHFHNLQAVGGS